MNQIEFHPDNGSGTSKAKRLHLRRSGSMLAGVCNGIAEYMDLDVQLVRLGAVVSVFITGWAVPTYIAAAFLLPADDAGEEPTEQQPLFDGQKIIEQIKLATRGLLKALAVNDRDTFKRCWNELIVNLRRAWTDAANR
jgi:phage shock protein C